MEVEAFDEISLICIRFLFRYPLGNQIRIIVGTKDRITLR